MAIDIACGTASSTRNGCGCSGVDRASPRSADGSVWLISMRSTDVP